MDTEIEVNRNKSLTLQNVKGSILLQPNGSYTNN